MNATTQPRAAGEAAHTPTRTASVPSQDFSGRWFAYVYEDMRTTAQFFGRTKEEVEDRIRACNSHARLTADNKALREALHMAEAMAINLRADLIAGRTLHREHCAENLWLAAQKFRAALASTNTEG